MRPDTSAVDSFVEDHLTEPTSLDAKKVILGVLSALLACAVVLWGLPWAARTTWAQIGAALAATPVWLVALAIAAGLLSVTVGALPLSALRSLDSSFRAPMPVLVGAYASGNALALSVPGGGVMGVSTQGIVFRRAGARISSLLAVLLAVTLVDLAVTSIALPLLGIAGYGTLLATGHGAGLGWLAALAAAIAVVTTLGVCLLIPTRFDGLVRGAFESLPAALLPGKNLTPEAVIATHRNVGAVLRHHPLRMILPPLIVAACQAVVLWAALQAAGSGLGLLGITVAFTLGRVAALIPVTPGGAGVSESVVALCLVALGVPGQIAAGAALMSLLTTVIVPVLAGALAALPLSQWTAHQPRITPSPGSPSDEDPRSDSLPGAAA